MSLREYKLINSEGKKNIRFAAVGSYQVEFFELGEKEYFTSYRFYGGQGQCICLPLSECEVLIIDGGYKVALGKSIYLISVFCKKEVAMVSVSQKLWGWLLITKTPNLKIK